MKPGKRQRVTALANDFAEALPCREGLGGFARACRLADSHGPLTVSPSDTAVDRPVRIGQDGGAVSAVVIDRSRTVLMERCRLIVR
jgi:hypothetical protein